MLRVEICACYRMGGDGITVATVPYVITAVEAHSSTITVDCSGVTCTGIRQGDLVTAGSAVSEPLPGYAKVRPWLQHFPKRIDSLAKYWGPERTRTTTRRSGEGHFSSHELTAKQNLLLNWLTINPTFNVKAQGSQTKPVDTPSCKFNPLNDIKVPS